MISRPSLLHPVADPRTGKSVVVIPSMRSALSHALPALIEGVIGPAAVFYAALVLGGFDGACYAGLGWSVCAVLRRLLFRQRVPGTLWLSIGLLSIRTVIAVLTGSPMLYFLQPTLGTCLVGLAFLASAGMRRPFIERLAHDFCPFSPELLARRGMRRFFVHLSLLWATVMLVNAGIVFGLLLTSSLRAFVVERTVVTWALSGLAIGLSAYVFARALRREGLHLRLRPLR
jgi:hypothetical protein